MNVWRRTESLREVIEIFENTPKKFSKKEQRRYDKICKQLRKTWLMALGLQKSVER